MEATITKPTPGRVAHDTWCALDDWHEVDDDERELWEETARKAHAAFTGADQSGTVAEFIEPDGTVTTARICPVTV
jgi:hypothetical protein